MIRAVRTGTVVWPSMEELRTEPRQRRSRRSIDSILDAAERLIDERGQVSFTAHELASAAETSVGRVYYWFPDMPTVVAALGERGVARLSQAFGELHEAADRLSARELVVAVVDRAIEFFRANPALVVLALTGGTADDHGRTVRTAMHDLATGFLVRWAPQAARTALEPYGRSATAIVLSVVRDGARADDVAQTREHLTAVLTSWLRGYSSSRARSTGV